MKFVLYAATFLVMSLTVPWFFSAEPAKGSAESVSGLPQWVVYNIGASVFYAALVAAVIHSAWNISAGNPGDEAPEPMDRSNGGADQ